MPINPDTYWTPRQIEATAKYARLRTFKTESEAHDFVFRSLERTDATFGAISGVNGPALNRAVADRVPLYPSGKSWKIGKRIRNPVLKWTDIEVTRPSLAPLLDVGYINPFDGYTVKGLKALPTRSIHETEDHARTPGGREKVAGYAARIKSDRTFVAIVVNQHGVVLDGHHRLHAVRDVLKWKTIPCLVVHVNDGDETASPTVMAYHGTSSRWLRDILKQGMQPARTKVGRWAGAESDPDASAQSRSRASYGGVYWTPNLGTARSAATNQLIKQWGSWDKVRDNVLIVCAMIQPQGAVGDEDNFGFHVDLPDVLYPFVIAALRTRDGARLAGETVAAFNRNVMAFVERHVTTPELRRDLPAVKALAREVFLTEIERKWAYGARAGVRWRSAAANAVQRMWPQRDHNGTIPKVLHPLSPQVAEQRARRALDLFIYKVRGSVKRGTDAGDAWSNFRTLQPVTYRGRNRIVCVVELNKRSEAIVHYGALPADFVTQYKARVGQLSIVKAFTPDPVAEAAAVLTVETAPPKGNPERAFSYSGIHYDQRNGLGAVPNNASIDYMGMAIVITPRQFLRLAHDLDTERDGHVDYIKAHMQGGGAIGCPFLKFDFERFRVTDHEGRHRCRAISALHSTMADIVVHVFPTGGKRARSITPDMIARMASGDIESEQGRGYVGGQLFDTYWHAGAWHTIPKGT